MNILIDLLIILMILIIASIWWRRRRHFKWQQENQKIVDDLMNQTYQLLLRDASQFFTICQESHGQRSSIWGGEVLVFDYQWALPSVTVDLNQINEIVKATLERVVSQSQTDAKIKLLDSWLLADNYHFTIVFLANQTTINYYQDMMKINSKNE